MKRQVSLIYMVMSMLMTVCLLASNLFTTKIWQVSGLALTADLIVFPVSYILNDCISEVYGYRKARLSIWLAFGTTFLTVLAAQLVIKLPSAPFWDGGEHFDYIFRMQITVFLASLAAFLTGSTVNAYVLSRMKLGSEGRHFCVRAIVSSIAGDIADSLVFMPLVFWSVGLRKLLLMMALQVAVKVLYELAFLPLTRKIVAVVKKKDATDIFDDGISYNPFRIFDI